MPLSGFFLDTEVVHTAVNYWPIFCLLVAGQQSKLHWIIIYPISTTHSFTFPWHIWHMMYQNCHTTPVQHIFMHLSAATSLSFPPLPDKYIVFGVNFPDRQKILAIYGSELPNAKTQALLGHVQALEMFQSYVAYSTIQRRCTRVLDLSNGCIWKRN